MNFNPELLREISLFAFVLTFLGGVVTSIGPCNIATIPLIVGFVGGSTSLSRSRSFIFSLAFTIGMAITFMLLGVTASIVGSLFVGSSQYWYYLVAAVCFVIGLQMLGAISIPVPMWFGGLRERVGLKGVPGALSLGLVSGLVSSQCATPVLVAILTYVMAEGALVYGAALLFVYALGRGIPIILAGTFTGALKQLQAFGRWARSLEMTGGLIIIVIGVYFLWIA